MALRNRELHARNDQRRLCDHTPNALSTKSVLRKEIRLKMAHESCKSQIAVLEMNSHLMLSLTLQRLDTLCR